VGEYCSPDPAIAHRGVGHLVTHGDREGDVGKIAAAVALTFAVAFAVAGVHYAAESASRVGKYRYSVALPPLTNATCIKPATRRELQSTSALWPA
jgi:hypothetical protein